MGGSPNSLDPQTKAFYHHTLVTMQTAGVPFLVGGAYAFTAYTGIERHTKDFDVFLRRSDYDKASEALAAAGYRTELTFPHWLGKAFLNDDSVDLIFSSGNGIAVVGDEWFEHAIDGRVLDHPVKLCPAEEMIWSKSFIMERERYDGADVAHLLLAHGEKMDWQRLLRHFGDYWRVLLSHLILFGFIYPSERNHVPSWVMDDLLGRLQAERDTEPDTEKICRGTFISREQYLSDIGRSGYRDARLQPDGTMTPEEVVHWSVAIDRIP